MKDKVKIFASSKNWIEGEAVRQLEKTAELHGMVSAIGMPDIHPGRGNPVGAVFVSDGVIYPYQIEVWHKDFPALLNVTVIQRIQLKDGKTGHVVLFSDDIELPYDKMILYYRLRFQIEFTFRDAKQYWGLEDFMNIKATQVKNAANIAMFMVNLSRFLTEQNVANTEPSILDIKIRAQTAFYLDLILKNNPEIAKVISFEELQMNLADIGCIHTQKKAA
ncbi:MAG: RtcB family protein [Desulfamplus sp.]|nr:RtcB family protein [Desulfamplus sp.]